MSKKKDPRNSWFGIFPCVWLWASPVFGATPPQVQWVKATPAVMYSSEEKSLLFTAAVGMPPDHAPVTVTLLQRHPTLGGAMGIKYRWELFDTGAFGDVRAGDGIFSRKIEFNPRRPGTLEFAVYPECDQPPLQPRVDPMPTDLAPEQQLHVEVRPQPTFLEILQQVWHRIAHSNKSP